MTRLHLSSLSLIVVALLGFTPGVLAQGVLVDVRIDHPIRLPRPIPIPPRTDSAAAVELQDRLDRSERQAHRSGRARASVARHSRTPAACRWKSASCSRCRTTARSTS